MQTKGGDTRREILETCRQILAKDGLAGLTFDAVARRLGVTKQAIIYWFPTKQDLLRDLVVPWIRAEAAAVIDAVASAQGARDGIARAVHALVRFHCADLDRFRQIYLAVQLDRRPDTLLSQETLKREVHPVTAEMYGALERVLKADRSLRSKLSARQVAVSVHLATLGLVMMTALGAAIGDPLAHGTAELVETLTKLLTTGATT